MVWVRTSIRNLKKCLHGGLNKRLLEAMHINTKNIIDFSANLNPYGPPKFILRAVKEAITDVCLYPDSECDYLRQAISEKIKCAKNEVLVGRGITGHLQSIGLSFINERAVMPAHTYGEYFVISKMMGAKVKFIPMPNLKIEPKAFAENMRRSDVIFICNPNNPTGQYLGKEATKLIVDCAKEKDALVIIDEAYVDFIKNKFDTTKLATDSENLIVLRSFTKSYSIPGIRVGYAVSHEKNIEILAKVAPPWSVSVFEQIAGLEAVKDKKFLKESVKKIWKSKIVIEKSIRVVPSDANFYLIKVENATKAQKILLNNQLLVRDCTSFGLPEYIRVSVRKDKENVILIGALQSLLQMR